MPTNTRILSVSIASANTEYSLNCGTVSSLQLRCRDDLDNIRVALVAGKVAGPTEPYKIVYMRQTLTLSFSPPEPIALYAASQSGGLVLEVIAK